MRTKTTRKNTITKTIAMAAATAMITLTSCTTTNPATDTAPSPQGPPSVTLRVPETIPAGQSANLVIESTGYEGKKADLYAFSTEYDSPAQCTDTTVKPIPITLKNGPQTIPLATEKDKAAKRDHDDIWYVLIGEGFSTPCGAPGSKTRLLETFAPTFEVCPPGGGGLHCAELDGSDSATIEKPFKYRLSSPAKNSSTPVPANATATWVGPFATLPEAKASPCKQDPVAITDTKELESGSLSYFGRWETTLKKPGIYRVMFSIPSTPYSAPYQTPCEAAPLVTVNAG